MGFLASVVASPQGQGGDSGRPGDAALTHQRILSLSPSLPLSLSPSLPLSLSPPPSPCPSLPLYVCVCVCVCVDSVNTHPCVCVFPLCKHLCERTV